MREKYPRALLLTWIDAIHPRWRDAAWWTPANLREAKQRVWDAGWVAR